MQPRGQLWFALEALCRDFKDCSGLEPTEALKTLVIVFTNMAAEQQAELDRLTTSEAPPTA